MKQSKHTQREREAQRGIALLATVTNDNQPLQMVTKSLYIVTHLGQLPFMLFTQMVRTWAIKEDSVNTSIIHLYSTLPRNRRIHRLSKKYRYRHRFSDRSVWSSRQDPKTEDRTRRVGRAEADRQCIDVGCTKPSCAMSGFNRTDMSLRPSIAEETGTGLPKDTWSFHLRHYRL